jgi:hypothetical protein
MKTLFFHSSLLQGRGIAFSRGIFSRLITLALAHLFMLLLLLGGLEAPPGEKLVTLKGINKVQKRATDSGQ